MAVFTVSITDGTTLANLAVAAGRGPKGDGFTGVTYNTETGRFVFTSNDGLGFVSDDITVDLDAAVVDAQTAATQAEGSATAASTSASNASTSATSAATSATNASNSATAASTSASNAGTSATNASNSASAASSSASSASSSAASAAASFDSFDDRYLGAKASAPTLDNDGNALLEGSLYWNSTSNILFVWDGASWQNASSFQVGGTASLIDGSASEPALRFSNDLDTGIYRSGPNSFGFTTGGTEAATFEDAGQTVFQLLSSVGNQLLNVDETTDDLLQVINTDDNILFQVSNTTGTSTNGEFKATSYNETFVTLSGTTPAVNCETGNVFALTTSGNTTFTFTNPPATGTAYGFTLKVTAGGTHTLTWPVTVDWAGGSAPDAPASGAVNVYVFFTHDGGTNWYGFLSGGAMA